MPGQRARPVREAAWRNGPAERPAPRSRPTSQPRLPAFLMVAWVRVRGNKGARSAGVDGQTAYSIEAGQGLRCSSTGCGPR